MPSLIPPAGTYVVWGETKAPEVRVVDPQTRELLTDRRSSSNPTRRAAIVPAVFGRGFTEIINAWEEKILRVVAEHYEGPQQSDVRALCAAMVLGIPFQELNERREGRGGEGGLPVRPVRRPVRPSPSGAAVAVPVSL